MKILAIDDNPDNLTVLAAVMHDALPDCTLLTAPNGSRGLELALAEDPDVILLDIVMPGMDGYEVCRRLKADDRLRSIPVVFLTALRTDRESRVQALESGAEAFLSKPVDEQELVAEVRAMSKIKAATILQRDEHVRLRGLVAERTRELQQSEERFRVLFEQAPMGYQSLDADGRFIVVNQAWLETLGYLREEVIGKWFGEFLAPEFVEAFRERFSLFKATGRIHSEFQMLRKDGERRFIAFEGRIAHTSDGGFKQTHCILQDITERKRAQEAERASELQLQGVLESTADGILAVDKDGMVIKANSRFAEMWGIPDSLRGNHDDSALLAFVTEKVSEPEAFLKKVQLLYKSALTDTDMVNIKDGRVFERYSIPMRFGNTVVGRVWSFRDITERIQGEIYRDMSLHILEILNGPDDLKEAIRRVIAFVKTQTGVDAVGLRLQDGEDFPYFAQEGFSDTFMLTENTLVERGPDGVAHHDKDGKICLECTCGLVLSGKTDPANPLFTNGGSFWTNDAALLSGLPSDQDPRYHPRNQCILHGYASVALIPVRDKERIVGLLHINSRRKGCFSLATVKILEDIASHIGAAMTRRKAEERLQEQEENYHTLADSGMALIWTAGTDKKCDYFNQIWLKFTGRTLEQELGDGWAESVHPDDLARCFKVYTEAFDRRETFSMDYRMRRYDGEFRWIHDEGTPRYDRQGKFLGYIGHCLDITERKQGEEALRESEVRFTLLAEQSGTFIWEVDAQGFYTYVSSVSEKVLGYPPDELIGRMHFYDLHPESGREAFKAAALEFFRQKKPFTNFVNAAQAKDGGTVWLITTGLPLLNADGSLRGYRGSDTDITERKRTEAELQKLDKLQSVGTLAGGIAHDFNNVLLGLYGNISLAMEDLAKTHPSYPLLEEAEKSMTRAVQLTKQLLTFAKGGEPVKENVSLVDLVEEVARFDLTGSSVSLIYHHAPDIWSVDADKGQIQQVVSNLVINARQAMPNGGRLQITLENADLAAAAVPTLQAGRYVKIAVKDEGTGVDPMLLDRIFDPYFTTKQSGSGLGLATVWSIISKHNGHIDVVSVLGKGTTFTFYLPATVCPRSSEAGAPIAECLPPVHPAKILVMDDEVSINKLVVRMLAPSGYTVVTALDGQETLALYKQALEVGAPFDAVIMDLTIPGGPGGKDVIKDLLAIDPNIRAIVSSGYAEDPVMSNPTAYGFKCTVAKPYTSSALRDAVARVLG